jgi:hypothetical protein
MTYPSGWGNSSWQTSESAWANYAPPTVSAYDGQPWPESERYQLAVRRAEARYRFYKKLLLFITINAALWFVAIVIGATSRTHPVWAFIWPLWFTVPSGLRLLHYYVQNLVLDESARRRLLEDELRRLRY